MLPRTHPLFWIKSNFKCSFSWTLWGGEALVGLRWQHRHLPVGQLVDDRCHPRKARLLLGIHLSRRVRGRRPRAQVKDYFGFFLIFSFSLLYSLNHERFFFCRFFFKFYHLSIAMFLVVTPPLNVVILTSIKLFTNFEIKVRVVFHELIERLELL